MKKHKIEWAASIPFFLMHIAVLAAFFLPFRWEFLAWCLGSYVLFMFGITAGYHRYFSHRSYKMGRIAQFAMAWTGSLSVQKGVLWWAAHHRHHHRHSDQVQDIHSPVLQGFWWSHVGWILSDGYSDTQWDLIADLAKYPELRWLNKYHLLPGVLYAGFLFAVGGAPALVWGFVISVTLCWHATFAINSLAHVFGKARYRTTDTSRNNFWLAIVTLGEGWHNNHHCYMSSARQGFFWWEIDASFYALRILSWFGITRDLRLPPLKLLESKYLKPAPRVHAPRQTEVEEPRQLERA
jgi:stearoyl-CoA desaturase (delta-9 desaturase)